MSVNYRKLLPKLMQNTRWGDLAVVIQDLFAQIKTNCIDIIWQQFTKEYATIDQLKTLAVEFGYRLLSLDGISSQRDFIVREIASIPYKIKYKTGMIAYQWAGYPFNLISQAFTAIQNDSGLLWSQKIQTLFDQSQTQVTIQVTTLDPEADNVLYYYTPVGMNFDSTSGFFGFDLSGITFDYEVPEYLLPQNTGAVAAYFDSNYILNPGDTDNIQGSGSSAQKALRILMFDYYAKRIETTSAFLSQNSLLVLKNDIEQIKKTTEKAYYCPRLKIQFSHTLQPLVKTFYDYEAVNTATQESVLSIANLLRVTNIQFGSGTISSPLTGTITGVAKYMYYIPNAITSSGMVGVPSGVAGWNYQTTQTASSLNIDFLIPENNHFNNFTEIALMSNSGCVGYAKFPQVSWLPTMNNNIHLELTIV